MHRVEIKDVEENVQLAMHIHDLERDEKTQRPLDDTVLPEITESFLNHLMKEFEDLSNYFPCSDCEYYSESEDNLKEHNIINNEKKKDLNTRLRLEMKNIKKLKLTLKKKMDSKRKQLTEIENNMADNNE